MFRPEEVKKELEEAKRRLGVKNLAELSRKIDFPYGTMRQWEQADQPMPNTRKWNEFLQKVQEAEAKGGEERAKSRLKEVQKILLDRAAKDEGFKKILMSDPRKAVQDELGQVPEGFGDIQIEVLQETPHKIYVILPSKTSPLEDGELTDEDLEDVAGGAGGPQPNTKTPPCNP